MLLGRRFKNERCINIPSDKIDIRDGGVEEFINR